MKKAGLFQLCVLFCFITINASALFAQFLPTEAGYDTSEQKLYKDNKIHIVYVIVRSVGLGTGKEGDTAFIYTYDNAGRLTDYIIKDRQAAESDIAIHYTYSTEGILTTSTNTGFEEMPLITSFSYDKTGKMIASEVKGEEPRKDQFMYDAKGKLTTRTGSVFMSPVDSLGNPSGPRDWQPSDKDIYKWFEDGSLQSGRYYFGKELYMLVSYEYNTSHQMIYENYFNDEQQIISGGRTMFIYNDEGLPVVRIEYNAFGDRIEQLGYVYVTY